ncbi:MAG: hypothetical protein GXY44_04045 [Phycisphaerales bacterium]|nr:hypothetical protein [Phycisphaerales bacterium]
MSQEEIIRADHDQMEKGPSVCTRRDLTQWAEHGGPLPRGLAVHIRECPACAERVRRLSIVHASLGLICTQPSPANLVARSNGRGLRMLRRVERATVAARRLLLMRPDLPRWQRAQIHAARFSLAAAASLLMLLMRMGIMTGFEQTRRMGEQLAAAHWNRHIDPDREFLDPPDFA